MVSCLAACSYLSRSFFNNQAVSVGHFYHLMRLEEFGLNGTHTR
ncbi:hypothetical protein COLO4_12810 [Corchorus olitorius]|uniref:Uncharacterized protein n=1 Tax=Corchorus olitorius TaxID=93759 RepID=A0A1R3JZD1_9ROSI|nr:hypothetical protein COLO4_12810 [Corchorus olitorius]